VVDIKTPLPVDPVLPVATSFLWTPYTEGFLIGVSCELTPLNLFCRLTPEKPKIEA